MTTSTTRNRVGLFDHRIGPEVHFAVRICFVRRLALSCMTDSTTPLRWIVDNWFVRDENGRASDGGLSGSHGHMAGNAAVTRSQSRIDDLAQLHRNGAFFIPSGRLNAPPLSQKVLLHRRNAKHKQHSETRKEQQVFVLVHGSVPRPIRWRPVEDPVGTAEIRSNDRQNNKSAEKAGEQRDGSGPRGVVFFHAANGVGPVR